MDCKRIRLFTEVTQQFDPPPLDVDTLVVDGLFGSGLNKPLAGGFASLVKYINQSPAQIVSIDLPSGLMAEDNTFNVLANIIRADLTLTLQQKKLSFMFPENQQFIGELKILDIRLNQEFIRKKQAQYVITEETDLSPTKATWATTCSSPAATEWPEPPSSPPRPACAAEPAR